MRNASSPHLAYADSTSQHPMTVPVRPIPPRRSLSLRMSRLANMNSLDSGHGVVLDRELVCSKSQRGVQMSCACVRSGRCWTYGESSPNSARSMKVRTPAARSLSSFWVDDSNGDQGCSQAVGLLPSRVGNGTRAVSMDGWQRRATLVPQALRE